MAGSITLYSAGFDMDHIPKSQKIGNGREWWSVEDMLRPDAFNIKIYKTECRGIDKSRGRLLLVQDDGTEKWVGPWAPHCDMGRDPFDAVQMLRWNCHSTGFRWDIGAWGGIEETAKWQRLFATRYKMAVRWLVDNGVPKEKHYDPWYWNNGSHAWHPPGNNPAPRCLWAPWCIDDDKIKSFILDKKDM
jgi:hypothetical protein